MSRLLKRAQRALASAAPAASVRLARRHTFEEVASLLWSGELVPSGETWAPVPVDVPDRGGVLDRLTWATQVAATSDPDRRSRDVAAVGRRLIPAMVDALAPAGDGRVPELRLPDRERLRGTVAGRLWSRLAPGRPPSGAIRALNGALVALADHELAASTLAVRVAASTRADPYAAVSAGLAARLAGAGGRHVEMSLMQAAAAFLAPKIVEHGLEGEDARPLNAPAGVYRTRDGWVAVTLSREAHFPALCRAIGRDDLAADPRHATFETRADHQVPLKAAIAQVLATRETAHWLERFTANEVMANPVSTLGDWVADPQVRAVGAVSRVAVPGLGELTWPAIPGVSPVEPGEARGAWSRVGEGGLEALRGFGFDDAELAGFRAAGIGAGPRSTP